MSVVFIVFMLFLSIVQLVPQSAPKIASSTVTIYQDDSLLYANATIVEVISGHAWANHGTQVNDAFKCLNDKGSTRSFKTFGMVDESGNPIPTNLWLCFDGKDWYAIITTTLEKVGGNRIGRLVTAYLVDKSKFGTIDAFISEIKTSWRAIEINFIIEAGSVFLSPK